MQKRQVLLGPMHGIAIRRGIHRYAIRRERWRFHHDQNLEDALTWLDETQVDGAILRWVDERFAQRLQARGIAVVLLGGFPDEAESPSVCFDFFEAGRLAARHLIARGLTELAWSSEDKPAHNRELTRGFLHETGRHPPVRVHRFESFRDAVWFRGRRYRTEVAQDWLRSLPKPVGLGCMHDKRARWFTETSIDVGIRVPERIAVMGVQNTAECTLTYPYLSAVELSDERLGYEAMQLLDELLQGKVQGAPRRLIRPSRVVARQSTDVHAIQDDMVAEALGFIREHACDPIAVPDVARHLGVSRTKLVDRFHAALGRTPGPEIRRMQVARARELITATDLTFAEISRLVGVNTPQQLCNFIKRETGLTPTALRKGGEASSGGSTD